MTEIEIRRDEKKKVYANLRTIAEMILQSGVEGRTKIVAEGLIEIVDGCVKQAGLLDAGSA
jgi:hypothetical protein